MATKFLLAEQVLNRLTGGRPDQASRYDRRDIEMAVGQATNEAIKGQYFSVTLPSGDTIPEASVLATYENVPVEEWKGISRSKLPALPISLPRGMGVYMISDNDKPHCLFIPALAGQLAMVESQKMISNLCGIYAYEQFGSYVEYNKNLIKEGTTSVMMRLLVTDVMSLSIYDTLPLPADYEAGVVDMVYKRFAQQGMGDKNSDVLINTVTQ